MQKPQSEFVQALAEQLRGIMDSSGATFDLMQRALTHACNAEGQLDRREATTAPLRVNWSADADVNFDTEEAVPALAALDVWQRTFNRGLHQPDGEQPCVFDVVEVATGRSARVDLALPEYRDLFPMGSGRP